MENRLNRLIEQLKANNLDSIFITSKENVFYFSNYYTDPHERIVTVFVDQQDNPILLLPQMEQEDAKKAGWKGEMLAYDDNTNPWDKFYTYLKESNRIPQKIAVEKDHLTVKRFEALRNILPSIEMKDGTELLNSLRVVKDKKEYALLKQAASLADLAVKTGIEAITDGISEMEIVAQIEYVIKKEGVQEMSFPTTVLAGKKSASPHGTPSSDKVIPGDFVLFDLGVVYEGYCSDITRTVAFKHISDEQKTIYNTVLQAQQAAIDASRVGTEARKVDQAARAVIENQEYGEYFTHRVGHGLGIGIHEFPSMNGQNTLLLEEGMCFTIEPGIYIPKIGGVRIEDDIFMTKKGAEVLTAYPKELQII